MVERSTGFGQAAIRVLAGMLLCLIVTSMYVVVTRGTGFRSTGGNLVCIAVAILCGLPLLLRARVGWLARILYGLLSIVANVLVGFASGLLLSCLVFRSCP